MLNLQKTIIFCLLFAAVWVQSSKAVTSEQKKEIKHLEKSLLRVHGNFSLIPKDVTNHFKSWKCWDNISDTDKVLIATRYKESLEREELDFESGTDKGSLDTLATLAYMALNDYIQQHLSDFAVRFEYHTDIVGGARYLKENGRYLELIAAYSSGFRGAVSYFVEKFRLKELPRVYK